MRARVLLAALLVAAVLPGVTGASHDAAGALNVFAAASLTEVFPAIDSRPRYNFAGSDQLATQIQQGAPADVFAAASPKYPELLYQQSLVEKPIKFVTNTLVLIVPKSNPAGIHSVMGLTKPGVKLVIGDATVPVGSYTRTVLTTLGISAAVMKNVVSQETDVRAVLSKVAAYGFLRIVLPLYPQATVHFQELILRDIVRCFCQDVVPRRKQVPRARVCG